VNAEDEEQDIVVAYSTYLLAAKEGIGGMLSAIHFPLTGTLLSLNHSPYALFADHFSPCPANLLRSFFMNSFGCHVPTSSRVLMS
jgi:hypothetical protein